MLSKFGFKRKPSVALNVLSHMNMFFMRSSLENLIRLTTLNVAP